MKSPFQNLIIEISSLAFLFLFLYTGYSKLADHANFQTVLSVSPLIGHRFAPVLSWSIPLIEICIAILLLIPATKKLSLYLSLTLMLIFTTYLIYMINSGGRLPCYCGGVISRISWHQHLWFNAAFIALALAAILALRYQAPLPPPHLKHHPSDLKPAQQ